MLVILFALGVIPTVPAQASRRSDCSQESIGAIPLNDLGTGTYQGAQGGLYPGGSNEIPPEHQELGLSLSASVGPLDESGAPSAAGQIGFMAVGVSATNDAWEGFNTVVAAASGVNPQIVLVDGGVSGHPIAQWLQPTDFPWGYLEDQVSQAGLTSEQIQVAWVMLPPRPVNPPPFPARQEEYQDQLKVVLANLKVKYPNLLLAYISSHQWAGYGTGVIVEPGNGYEHGFGVKWTIEAQIDGDPALNSDPDLGPLAVPWIAWGPYIWADGLNPRSDGLIWQCSDFRPDGTHPSVEGGIKLGNMLFDFLSSDPTASVWFLGEGREPRPPVTTSASVTLSPTTVTQEVTSTTLGPTTVPTRESNLPRAAPTTAVPETEDAGFPWLIPLVILTVLVVLAGGWRWARRFRR